MINLMMIGKCHGEVIFYVVLNLQITWTWSIYLEAVAILPQLFMVSKTGEAETVTSHYLFALGSYRGSCLLLIEFYF